MQVQASKRFIPAVGAGLLVPSVAFAQVDVSALVDTIEGTLAPIGLIGIAVLTVVVGVKVFRWIRSAM